MTTTLQQKREFDRLSTVTHSEQYLFQNKLLECVDTFFRKLFLWILCTLLVCGIAVGLTYAGYTVVANGSANKEYANSFNIKGTCLVIDTYQTTKYEDSSDVLMCKVEIYNMSHCNNKNENNEIHNIECVDFEAKIEDTMDCYTNNECDDIFAQKTNFHHDNAGSAYFWGVTLFILSCVGVTAYSLFVSKFCECGYWHRSWDKRPTYKRYKNYCLSIYAVCCFTKAKREYYFGIWNSDLNESQQFDYYISYHCRIYQIYLGHNVHDLMFSYYEEKNGYITEQHYIDTNSE